MKHVDRVATSLSHLADAVPDREVCVDDTCEKDLATAASALRTQEGEATSPDGVAGPVSVPSSSAPMVNRLRPRVGVPGPPDPRDTLMAPPPLPLLPQPLKRVCLFNFPALGRPRRRRKASKKAGGSMSGV